MQEHTNPLSSLLRKTEESGTTNVMPTTPSAEQQKSPVPLAGARSESSPLSERKSEALEPTPIRAPISIADPSTDSPLQRALRTSYEKRVALNSILFTDHSLPLQEVHFTIHESAEFEEKARLERRMAEEKESKGSGSASADAEQTAIPASQTLSAADIFMPMQQPFSAQKLDAKQTILASSQQKTTRRVLITGDAGSGKTTLSKFIADGWRQNTLWQGRYTHVFWLPLRALSSAIQAHPEEWLASPFPLATAIHQLCLEEPQQQAVGLKAIQRALIEHPEENLLLLDGYDEVAQGYIDAAFGDPLKTVLDAAFSTPCDLMLTSRGYSLPPNHVPFDRRLVNQGFNDEQVTGYIQRYFKSLGQEKAGEKILQLIRDNGQLWQQVHTPLILTLVCDIYRNSHESGQKLEDLSLLDLYDNTLKVFIRRYLDWQSQWMNDLTLAWKKTADQSLDELLALCPVEIQFLERLSFLGIEKGIQRFDGAIKQEALKELQKDYRGKARFIQAIKLGFLYEFPGPQTSALDKIHEFVHLTFEEYFAARGLAARLKLNEPAAYAWLRAHKYQPGAREVLNFLCMQMTPATYPKFWEILLEEQSDVTGLGHLQLVMRSLEAARCDRAIPRLSEYLQKILNAASPDNYEVRTIIHTSLHCCPIVIGQLTHRFWDAAITNPNQTSFQCLLRLAAPKLSQFSSDARNQLLAEMLKVAATQSESGVEVRSYVIEALGIYSLTIWGLNGEEHKQLLKATELFFASIDEKLDNHPLINSAITREACGVANLLRSCAKNFNQFDIHERNRLLANLLTLANVFTVSQSASAKAAITLTWEAYCSQLIHFTSEERHKMFSILLRGDTGSNQWVWLQSTGERPLLRSWGNKFQSVVKIFISGFNGESNTMSGMVMALCIYVSQIIQIDEERSLVLAKLLVGSAGENQHALRFSAVKALGECAARAELFTLEERKQFLTAILAAVTDLESGVRISAFQTLGLCVSQVAYFSSEEREQLLVLIMKEASVPGGAIRVSKSLELCATQLTYFNAKERSRIRLALQNSVIVATQPSDARKYTEVFKLCIDQAALFDSEDREALLDVLFTKMSPYSSLSELCVLHAKEFRSKEGNQILLATSRVVGSDKFDVRYMAVNMLELCVSKAALFTADEYKKILSLLLTGVNDPDENVRTSAMLALLQSTQITSDKRKLFLNTLVTRLAKENDKGQRRHYENIKQALDKINWSSTELLSLKYQESYAALSKMHMLANTALDQLLEAYVKDEASFMGGLVSSKNTFLQSLKEKTNTARIAIRPRNALWLQFVVRRAYRDGISITIEDNQFILYGAQYRTPFAVPIPTKNRASLIKNFKAEFAKNAKALSLPVSTKEVVFPLPPEIKAQPMTGMAEAEKFDAKLRELEAKQSQQKTEVKKIETRVDEHEKRLDKVEVTLSSLETHVKQHDVALQAQQEAMQAFKESMRVVDDALQTMAQTTEAKMARMGATLVEQEAALTQFAETVTTRFQDWEKEEQKRETIYKKQDAELFDKQVKLDASLTKIQQEIEQLTAADASSAAGLKALQERQEVLSRAYDENQARLTERASLLSHPNLSKFYRVMHLKLSGFFLVCTVVSTGLVKAESQATLSEKIASKVIGVLGDNIPVPGAKAAASFINSMIAWHSEHRTAQGRERAMEAAPVSFSEKEVAIDLALQEIVRRYGQHILVLTEQGVETLAECAVNRIAHGIQQEEQAEDISFPLRMVHFLHQVKLKQGRLGHKDIPTAPGLLEKGQTWNEDGIFRRTGIQSTLMYYYSDEIEHARLSRDTPICGYPKYGFREVKDDKQAASIAKTQGFDKASAALPEGSFQFKPMLPTVSVMSSPKGSFTMFGKIRQAATAVAKDNLREAAQGMAAQVAADPRAAEAAVKSAVDVAAGQAGEILSSVIPRF